MTFRREYPVFTKMEPPELSSETQATIGWSCLELGASESLGVTLLGLLEVDDVPDGVEVLKKKKQCIRYVLEWRSK